MLSLEQCMMILNSIDGLVVTDEKGIVIYFDDKTAKGMDLEVNDFIGKYIHDVLPLTKIHTVLETKQHDIGDFYFIDDREHRQYPIVISTRHPMYYNNKFSGVVEYDLFENYNVLKQFLKTTDSLLNELTLFKKRKKGGSGHTIDDLVGSSVAMQKMRKEIFKAANSQSTVIITGETGSGKELVAHAIHNLSKRKSSAFVSINCAAIPNELFESELFGYEEGSFTSAKKGGKPGKFELANKGTLFLDEINTLSINMQPKLLRVLQEKELDRIGGKTSIPIDVRVVCATNQPLEKLVKSKMFREDLFFRLNVIPINVPPLRDRIEDIPEIAYACIENLNLLLGRGVKCMEKEAISMLQGHDWPGNVRELQNVLERAMNNIDANDEVLRAQHIPESLGNRKKKITLQTDNPIKEAQDAAEREVVIYALKTAGGNKAEAARLLKIARPVLYRKMERLKIENYDYGVTE